MLLFHQRSPMHDLFNSLYMLGNFSCFFLSFFKIHFSQKNIRNTDSVKHFGPRSGPTICRSWSGSKLFAEVIKQITKVATSNEKFSSGPVVSDFLFALITALGTLIVSNSLDPDQDRHFVGPDLGPNCLQRLSSRWQKLPLATKSFPLGLWFCINYCTW